MPILLNEDRKYQRLKHTQEEKNYLARFGFTTVVSSNVSAIARDGDTLYIRFHGGATYGYPKSGGLYEPMLESASKGKFVWAELIRKNVPYYRTSSKVIIDDVEDRDMMRPPSEEEMRSAELEAGLREAGIVDNNQATDTGLLLSALGVAGVMSKEEALGTGIIAGLVYASLINETTADRL